MPISIGEIARQIEALQKQVDGLIEMLNIGERSVARAREVQRDAIPEITKAVESGKVAVSAAAAVAKLPKPEQQAIAAAGDRAIVEKAKELREAKKKAEEKLARLPTPEQALERSKLTAFVVSLNLHRRHLNESQRAMVAAKLANLEDGQRADLTEGLPIGRASNVVEAQEKAILVHTKQNKRLEEHGKAILAVFTTFANILAVLRGALAPVMAVPQPSGVRLRD